MTQNKTIIEKNKGYYITISAILIILIWFACGIFDLVSQDLFWSGLIGFIAGGSLMSLDRRYNGK